MINYIVIPLGEILSDEFDQKSIEESLKKFSCQLETDLEDFLSNKAILYEKSNFGKTFLIIDEEKLKKQHVFTVMAYFTIAQKSLDISKISGKKKRAILGAYPGREKLNSISTYLIGQLGRCDTYTKDMIDGQTILNECYYAISLAARIVGGNLVVLECRECMYDKFYERKGFLKLDTELNEKSLFTLYKKVDFKIFWSKKIADNVS